MIKKRKKKRKEKERENTLDVVSRYLDTVCDHVIPLMRQLAIRLDLLRMAAMAAIAVKNCFERRIRKRRRALISVRCRMLSGSASPSPESIRKNSESPRDTHTVPQNGRNEIMAAARQLNADLLFLLPALYTFLYAFLSEARPRG